MDLHDHFPQPRLARALLPHALEVEDGAHDAAHLLRVWRNVARIAGCEGGDMEILLAATLLHDCVWIDKGSPHRAMASRLAAAKARGVLSGLDWPEDRIGHVCHAIEAHSFSAAITPLTPEAEILQDADRLDSMGFIGVARTFYVAGMRRAAISDAADPAAAERPLDDTRFALDHFRTKLMHLEGGFRTATGRRLAAGRAARLRVFYQGLLEEIG